MLQSTVREGSDSSGVSLRLPPGTFLLNPDNARRILGQSQLWNTLKKELLVFLLLLCLGGFLLLITLQGLKPLLLAAHIQQSGVAVEGNVIGKRAAQAEARVQVSYYLKYRFMDSSGELFDAEQSVSRPTYERFQMGDFVPVRYLGDNPLVSALTNHAKDDILALVNYLVTLTGGIGFLVTVGSLLFLGWTMWQEDQFFLRGRLIMGHMLACHTHLESLSQTVEVREQGSMARGRIMAHLSYSFCPPGRKPIKGFAKRQRNDLCGHELPKFGHPVAILYLDDKHYKLL